ncbi:MAG: AAC(3) family N-acetyltransferase [Nitrospirae bacterium]|nr:AAC(3) family N-acetyltransferase [Nitrospirota bacterium]
MDPMPPVGETDLREAMAALGLQGRDVVVHASLRSLGRVEGAAETVIRALVACCSTLMMPAFSADSHAAPPADDHPLQNGCDYRFYDTWTGRPGPFDLDHARINPRMGALALEFARRPDVQRSYHPWHSWSACGTGAKEMVADHPWDRPNAPVEKLARKGGWGLLVGVSLTACTAIHLAEERAGRRPFIRWAIGPDGGVRRIRVAGCAKGFERLMPQCRPLFREHQLGPCQMLAAPLEALIARAAELIRADPEITRCSPECLRCRDAILGGPHDPER